MAKTQAKMSKLKQKTLKTQAMVWQIHLVELPKNRSKLEALSNQTARIRDFFASKNASWINFSIRRFFPISSALSHYCLSLKVIIVLKTSSFYIKKSSEKNSQRRKSHGKTKAAFKRVQHCAF